MPDIHLHAGESLTPFGHIITVIFVSHRFMTLSNLRNGYILRVLVNNGDIR